MRDPERIRRRVSRAYGRVVGSPAEHDSGGVTPKGFAVKLAGYSPEALGALPPDAVANACGCGNPLASCVIGEGDIVLDLGCGAGIDLLLAAERVGPRGRAIGVDMTDAMLAKARDAIAEAGLDHAEVRKGLIEDLPVATGSVDWVISNCVINLSPQKRSVFAEIARVLKPGGRMLVSDIVAEGLPEAVRKDLRRSNTCVGRAISEQDYVDGLHGVGLVDVAISKRIAYDVSGLRQLLRSDRRAYGEYACSPDGGEAGRPAPLDDLAAACAGRVWSASIRARKPRASVPPEGHDRGPE